MGAGTPLLPVCAPGNGDSWCLDLGSPDAEPPVVDWCHELADENGYVAEQVADGYAAWIVGRLREMVEQKRGRRRGSGVGRLASRAV